MASNERDYFNASQGVTCLDINECRKTSDICGPNSVCENVAGSYFCMCKEGFRSSNGRDYFNASQGVTCVGVLLPVAAGTCSVGFESVRGNCTDENECEFDNPICGDNAICHNTDGSYYCQCAPGYRERSGRVNFTQDKSKGCEDINECRQTSDICGPNSVCQNVAGSYSCKCKEGFMSSNEREVFNASQGVTCLDRDECQMDLEICGQHAKCKNTIGRYNCTCDPGYSRQSELTTVTDSSKQCEDINECRQTSDICVPNFVCENVAGSYSCKCKDGFRSSNGREVFNASQGVTCVDIDECRQTSDICGPNSVCENVVGSYSCACKKGFRFSNETEVFNASQGVTCVGDCIDEFLCGEGECHLTPDGYECVCSSGFTNYGFKTVKCTKPNFGFLMENGSAQLKYEPEQIPQMLKLFMTELKSHFENLTKGVPDIKQRVEIKLLEKLLKILDELLSGGPLKSNKEVTAILEVTEILLRPLGFLLPNTTMSSSHTEIKVLVRRGDPQPHGPIILSTNDSQLQTHWETVVGNSYLGFAGVSLLTYKSLNTSVNNYFNRIETQEGEKLNINSEVVTAVVTNLETAQLKEQIVLTLTHLEPSVGNQTCVFWNSTLDGGAWSTKGCSVVISNDSHTVCSCSHLSSFAVLMALHEMKDVFELRMITWVGLSLSLVCLFICILTFWFVRSIQSTRTTIHLHLCISLFIADLIFIAGITRTENEVGCAFVAGLLHYFFLAVFCWMCLEGIQLFRMVVLVFNTTLRPLYLMVGGYGVPAIIVIISASINAKGYGTKKYCWLSLNNGFIWSFFGPVCIIIVVNIFFFLITVWKLAQKFSSLNQDLSMLHKIKTFTITAIAQLCVLGTMWIFGCFQFDGGSLVTSYLFTIFNSLQGVLMFLMHCLLYKQVREEYVKILISVCAPQKKKYTEFSTNQSSKSQASKSIQNTRESQI
ncbi:adhesion G protein-coupled receptor E5 isoform X2 [Hoplias malabaricus]|uniref:adhesion G protein-coupled receptor E5 isoform X2 n=1 Tax=Hoplias malabaricus TaxID=27720 RepID=UPI003462F2ED